MQFPIKLDNPLISPSPHFQDRSVVSLANVNRWLGQVGIEQTDEEGLKHICRDRTVDEKPAKLVLAESDNQALVCRHPFP